MTWDILTEFTTKKGQDLVVCNLSDQVDRLGVKQMIQCPYCSTPELTIGYSDNRRRKLETDGYVGYCYRCNRAFINPKGLDHPESTEMTEMNMSFNIRNFGFDKLDNDLFDSSSELSDEGLSYLQKRNPIFSKEFCNLMNIRSVPNGVCIPFYLSGEFVFYVIRFINATNGRRYHMPTGVKPLYIPKLINQSKFIIVEGVFDAFACMLLYPDYTPCAVLGSKITERQLRYLSDRFSPESILVYLDDTEKSDKTKKYISNNWIGSYDIDIVESDGTDPEEYLNKLLKDE